MEPRRGIPAGAEDRDGGARRRRLLPRLARSRAQGARDARPRNARSLLRSGALSGQRGRPVRSRGGARPMTVSAPSAPAYTTEDAREPEAVARRLARRGVSLEPDEV